MNNRLVNTGSAGKPILVGITAASPPKSYTSHDLGLTWSAGETVAGMAGTYPRNLSIAGDNHNMICIRNSSSADGVAYYSTDGGQTWSEYAGYTTTYMWGAAISGNGLNMATLRSHTTDYVYVSSNAGNSWVRTTALASSPRAIAMNYNGSLMLVCYHFALKIYMSVNGGTTYTSHITVMYALSIALSENAGVGTGVVFTGEYNSISVRISYCTTIGTSWTWNVVTLETGSTLGHTDVKCSGDGKYVFISSTAGSTGLWVSNNYGVAGSWTKIASVSISDISFYTISVSRSGQYMSVASATNGQIYYSDDFGVTWNLVNTGSGLAISTTAIQDGI